MLANIGPTSATPTTNNNKNNNNHNTNTNTNTNNNNKNNKNNNNNDDDNDDNDDDNNNDEGDNDDDNSHNNHRLSGLELCGSVCLCDGSPDYGCVALARAVSPLHWGGCYRDALRPGPRLAQGGVARAPTDSAGSCGRPGVV